MSAALLVLAKAPVAGRAKTRMCPPLTPGAAVALALAALEDTLAAAAACGQAHRRVLVLDGEAGPWLPPGFEVLAQRGDGLAERLASAFADIGGPALAIGMDTPQVTPALLDAALARLAAPGIDAVLGPATDGGYWAIGLRRPDPAVFADVPMSDARTGALQLARLEALRLGCAELAPLRDVDTFADALAVAELVPGSRFAAAVAAAAAS